MCATSWNCCSHRRKIVHHGAPGFNRPFGLTRMISARFVLSISVMMLFGPRETPRGGDDGPARRLIPTEGGRANKL